MKIDEEELHKISVEHGWWDAERTFPEIIALVHSELSEALEEFRNGHAVTEIYYNNGKPEGVPIELADAVIRILDYCAAAKIDIEAAILKKSFYNETRTYKHGGKVC